MPKQIVVRITWKISKPEKLLFVANYVYSEMSANAALFSSPKVPLKDFKAAIEETTEAYNKRKNGESAKGLNKEKLEELNGLLYDQAGYVNSIAVGSSAIILKSGFEPISNEVKKAVTPGSPKAAELKTLGNGTLKVNILKVEGAIAYTYVLFLGAISTITVDFNVLKVSPATEDVIILPYGKTFETFYNLPIGTTVTVIAFAQNSAGVSAASPAASRLIN